MRFGICYNVDYRPDVHKSPANFYAQMFDQIELLEELGYDSAWFSEHHSGPYSFGNPALMIATAATRTKRLKLGTGVSLLPLHHPLALSEEYAMVDVLTGGRLEYGIGRGYLMHEYPWLNIPLDESHARYRESVDFITQAWTSEGPMSFKGEYFNVEGYTPFPAVVQRPMPPIYASASSPESFGYAGSKNLHIGVALFQPGLNVSLPQHIANYTAALNAGGYQRAGREIMGITQMYCANDQQTALAEGRKYAENYYRFFSNLIAKTAGSDNPVSQAMAKADALAMNAQNMLLLGDPASLIEKITRMREEWQIDYLQLEVAQGGASSKTVCDVLRLFGEKVMPHFRNDKS